VLINGKRAEDASDDDLREFLQGKVREVEMGDGDVELVRLAPGYPATLRFREPIRDVAIGDKGLVETQRLGNALELSAKEETGDTMVKVFFAGEKARVFHVFVAPSFEKGDTMITVNSPNTRRERGTQTPMNRQQLLHILKVISNYDVLAQERAINPRQVTRLPIFRQNKQTGFTVYDLYRVDGAMAVTFAWENGTGTERRYDESRLRVWIGNQYFVPDYVHLNRAFLQPGEATSGVVIFQTPVFDARQPFEVVWNDRI
jgi:hypothetical protein